MTTQGSEDRFLEPRFLESEAYVARAPRRLMEVLGPFVIRRIGDSELYRRKRKYLHKFGPRVFDAMTFLRLMVPSEDEIKRNPGAAEHWDTFFYDLGKDAKECTERIIAFRNHSLVHPNSYDDRQVYDCLDDILGLLLAVRRAQEADPVAADVLPDSEASIEQVRAMLGELGSLLAVGDTSTRLSREKLDALLNAPGAASVRPDEENEVWGPSSPEVPETEPAEAGLELRVSLTEGASYEYRKGQANAMVQQARLAMEREAFEVAIANYRAVGTFFLEGQYADEHAAALHRRGKNHAKNRRYDLAIEDFAEAQQLNPELELDPEDAAAYHQLANGKVFAEEYDEAIGLFSLVLTLDPDGAAGYSVTRSTRHSTGSSTRGSRFGPGRLWEIYHDRGRAHLALGDYQAAIDDFDRSDRCQNGPFDGNELSRRIAHCFIAIQNNPADASAHLERARAYKSSGQYDKALSDLDRARDMDDSLDCSRQYWEIFTNRAGDYLDAGQNVQVLEDDETAGREYFEKAIAGFTEALEIDPSNAEILNYRGLAYFAVGQYRLAVHDYTAAFDVAADGEGNYIDAWGRTYEFDAEGCLLERGRTLVALAGTEDSGPETLDQAIHDLQSVMSGELLKDWAVCEFEDEITMGVDAHIQLAAAYLIQGNVDTAIGIYDHVITETPDAHDRDDLWELRGNALFRQKEYAAAISDLTRVLDLNPGYFKVDLLKTRGQAHAALGNYHQAIADYDEYMQEYGREQEVMRLRKMAESQLETAKPEDKAS